MSLGANIREAREWWEMTQRDVADHLEVTVPIISRYESGEKIPSLERLQELAELFEISIDELVAS